MPTKHLKYGGSTMARTLACPPWAALAAEIPRIEGDDGASEAAREGTALHDVMEAIFNGLTTSIDCIGKQFSGIEITPDMVAEKILPAESAIEHLRATYHIKNYILEPFVEMIPDLAGGSIDFLGFSADGKTAVVADYKFGYVGVSPENNAQLLFYALCGDIDPATSEKFKHVEKLVLAIIQPVGDDGECLKVWETDIGALDDFEDDVIKAINLAESGAGEHAAGSHCRFCPAEALCPVKTGLAQAARRLPELRAEQLAEYLPMAEQLEEWIKAVKKLAHEQLEEGVHIDGYKLVNKRASRVWIDADEVTAKVKAMRSLKLEEAMDMKLKSPAQMEKLFKAKGLDFDKIGDYITSVSSGTTMAKASDKRPEAVSTKAFKAAMERLPE